MLTTFNDHFLHLEQEIDEVFESIPTGINGADGVPAVSVADTKDDVLLIVEVPGVPKEDVKISLRDNMLTVSGERKPFTPSEGFSCVGAESWKGVFARSLELPHQINSGGITAELENGILRLTLPKTPEAKLREIAIK